MAASRLTTDLVNLVTLTPPTIRAREAAVQDSETSVYKMHEKDSEDSVYKMHEGWEMGDGRWKMAEVPTPPESRSQRLLEPAGRRPAPQPENLPIGIISKRLPVRGKK